MGGEERRREKGVQDEGNGILYKQRTETDRISQREVETHAEGDRKRQGAAPTDTDRGNIQSPIIHFK